MSTTIHLVGCGRAKLAEPAAAKDLYTGNLFRAARAHAEAEGGPWYILSAKHGLLRPITSVMPYDQRITRRRGDAKAWGLRAAAKLLQEVDSQWGERKGPYTVVALCGEAYWSPLFEVLNTWSFFRLQHPLMGLGIGEQLQWYKQQARRRARLAAAVGPHDG